VTLSSLAGPWLRSVSIPILIVLGLAGAAPLATQDGEEQDLRPAYLVYAGPHAASPPSAFGHLFLVLPDSARQPVPLWPVISFSAETGDAGPLAFMVKGVLGGFDGQYHRMLFHENSRDYELLEDRDLWLLELRLTAGERKAVERAVANVHGHSYPYTFFVRNCAFYLQKLLAEALIQIPLPRGPTSPADVYDLVAKTRFAGGHWHRPAATQEVRNALARASDETISRLAGTSWEIVARDTAWFGGLPTDDRLAVSQYFAWRAATHGSRVDDDTQRALGLHRALNAAGHNGGIAAAADQPSPGVPRGDVAFHRYLRISTTMGATGFDAGRLTIRIRPALHDMFDPWISHRPLNTMDLMAPEVSVGPPGNGVRLESFVLFSQRSLVPSSWLEPRRSWLLDVSLRRPALGATPLRLEAINGVGQTFSLGRDAYLYGLGLYGVFAGGGIDPSIGAEVGAQWLLTPRIRAGALARDVRPLEDLNRPNGRRAEAWARVDVTTRMGVRGTMQTESGTFRTSLSADLYP
jgi:hypothetical protein